MAGRRKQAPSNRDLLRVMLALPWPPRRFFPIHRLEHDNGAAFPSPVPTPGPVERSSSTSQRTAYAIFLPPLAHHLHFPRPTSPLHQPFPFLLLLPSSAISVLRHPLPFLLLEVYCRGLHWILQRKRGSCLPCPPSFLDTTSLESQTRSIFFVPEDRK